MYYINKLQEGASSAAYYVKYPFNYFNAQDNTQEKEIKELSTIDLTQLSPYVNTLYTTILLNNKIIPSITNVNPLVYQLANLHSDRQLVTYSYSINKICEIIYNNFTGNKFVAVYQYDEQLGYTMTSYKGKGDNLHKTQFINTITQQFGHIDILTIKYLWEKFDIYYESKYPLYNKIFVPCMDNPFTHSNKVNSINYDIIVMYLSESTDINRT